MKKYSNNITLFSILIVAAFTRLWGIGWGLPLKKAHIDESVVIFYTMRFLTGDLNPHVFFDYPSLFPYILGAAFFFAFLAGKTVGVFASLDQFVGIYLNGDASFIYIIARLISASFAIASVYLIYKIGRENFSRGLLPAFIFAITPLHVIHSHYATVDVACVFFVLLAFLFLGRYYQEGGDKNIYLGSFILGLGAAAKYYPAMFFLPLIYFIYEKNKSLSFRKVSAPVFCGILGFISGCPYAVLDFPAFASRFWDRFQLIVWSPKSSLHIGDFFLPMINLQSVFTLPMLIFIFAGILLSLKISKQNRKYLIFWLSFPVFYLLFLGTWKVRSTHYLMPVLPFIILIACYGYDSINWLAQRKWLKYALIAAFCVAPMARIYYFERMLTFRDTRLQSYDWIKQNLPRGSRILRLSYTPEFTQSDSFFVKVDWVSKMIGTPPQTLFKQYDYIIMTKPSDNAGKQWESNLLNYYKIINEWENKSGFEYSFHNPRVVIYGK